MENDHSERERRKAPRAASHIPIDVYDPQGHAVTAEGQFINLSTNGAMLETPKPFKIKDVIRLRYQPGRDPVLDVKGSVVWVVKKRRLFQYGVSFASPQRAA